MSAPVLIVDGMALLFRGYFASAYGGYIRKTSEGTPTNAIYGFTRYLLDAIRKFKPGYVVCCWDTSAPTFRAKTSPPPRPYPNWTDTESSAWPGSTSAGMRTARPW